MANVNLTFLTILAFFTMQVLAIGTCVKESTACVAPAAPTATVTIKNFSYEPNCLTVRDGTFVEWGICFYTY